MSKSQLAEVGLAFVFLVGLVAMAAASPVPTQTRVEGAHPGVRELDYTRACYYRDCALYLLLYSNQDELDYYQAIIDHLTGREKKT